VNETQLKECLDIVVQAEREMEAAKEDYKATTDAAFETYECTPDQIKAIKKVAKALLKDKVNGIDEETAALMEVIEAVKR
jgi:hypothetical protein